MTRAEFLVRTRALTGFVPLVKQLGGDVAALLAAKGLTVRELEDEQFSLPLRAFAELISDAATALNKPDFGILLAARQNLSVLGPIALAAQHAGCVGDALELVGRYMPYHSPGLTLTVSIEGDDAVLRLRHNLILQGEVRRHVTELPYAVSLAFMRMISRREGRDWQLSFQHDSPLSLARYRRLLGCPVALQQAEDSLRFPASLLTLPIDAANRDLQETAARTVRYLIQRSPLDLGQQVSTLVERSLATGNCTLPVIATQLQMPRHQLQRQLAALGMRFEDIVDNLRRERLQTLLPHSQIPLTEVALQLGYGDPSSLTRACHRWFGQSPKALRRAALPGMQQGTPSAP